MLVVGTAAVRCHVLLAVCTAVSLAADILLAAPLRVLREVGNCSAVRHATPAVEVVQVAHILVAAGTAPVPHCNNPELVRTAAAVVGRNYRVAGSVVCYASVCLLLANHRVDLRGFGVLTDSHRRSPRVLPHLA